MSMYITFFIVSKDAVTKMEGQTVFSYSHKRTNAVKSLESTRAVTVHKERDIPGFDLALLFQRRVVVSQSEDLCLEEVKKYELARPPSLFEGKNLLRKPDKAPFLHAVTSHAISSNDAILQLIPKTEHCMLDGGSLIHRLKGLMEAPTIQLPMHICVFHFRNVSIQIDNSHRRRH